MKLILALALPALAAASSPTFVAGAIVQRGVLNTAQTQLVVVNSKSQRLPTDQFLTNNSP